MSGFERPLLLLLLLLLPADIYLQHFWKGRGNRVDFPLALWGGGPLPPRQPGLIFTRAVSFCCYWGALAVFIVAAAGPVRIVRQEIYVTRGADIVFVIDESPSMAAQDLQPGNRFEAAKRLIRNYAAGGGGDHIGLVSFGSDAVLQLPPTTDFKTLIERVDSLEVGGLGPGTAIGLGIGVAVSHLAESDAPAKSVILLTDGVNNTGKVSPALAAKVASSLGIRIFTVGLGTPGESDLEYTDPDTGERYSGMSVDLFDTALLNSVAEMTGGRYFPAPNSELLDRAIRLIGLGEGDSEKPVYRFDPVPAHRRWIVAGLVLIIAHIFLARLLLQEIFP